MNVFLAEMILVAFMILFAIFGIGGFIDPTFGVTGIMVAFLFVGLFVIASVVGAVVK